MSQRAGIDKRKPKTMNKAFLAQQKARLLTLRRQDQETLQQLQAEIAEGIAENEVKDQEELAVINTQHKTEMAQRNLLQQRVAAINHALDAIDDGTYGTCERCGTTIAPERLEANPMAQYCLPCQEQIDAQQRTG
jgi:DnaK suppressor protein